MSEFKYEVLEILSMYDGDSINVRCVREHTVPETTMDFGFDDIVTSPSHIVTKIIDVNVRMHGYDTPELRDKRPDWKAAAYLARNEARLWVKSKLCGQGLIMITHKDERGKFGRYLANFVSRMDGTTLKDYLIENYMAVPYHGQNKMEIEKAHEANLVKLKELGRV